MKNFYSIKKAAELCKTTAETLRHYDRIGLVHPSETDEWTGYRYYSPDDIVRINTVRALQSMDFSLKEIKDILQTKNFEKIIYMLDSALGRADRKIEELKEAKQKILRARKQYSEKQAESQPREGIYERTLPQRTILLSDKLSEPTVENLTGYLRHFFAQTGENADKFTFEDIAGIYTDNDGARMFAVCKNYLTVPGLIFLPGGRYLCAMCDKAARPAAEKELAVRAEELCGAKPEYSISILTLTGILNWEYEVQILIE